MSATSSTIQDSTGTSAGATLIQLETVLANPPQFPGNAIAYAIITWVVGALRLTLEFIHGITREILAHIDNIEEDLPETSGGAPTD